MSDETAWEIYTKIYGPYGSNAPSNDADWNQSVADHIRRVRSATTDHDGAKVIEWWYDPGDEKEALRHARRIRRLASKL